MENLSLLPSMEGFGSYLQEYVRASTIKVYTQDVKTFIHRQGEVKVYQAVYQDILNYVDYLRKCKQTAPVISRQIASLKQFYSYLISVEYREHHPCKTLYLKDNKTKSVQLQNLFSTTELERLMERKERFTQLVTVKNKVLTSLLIYQALRLREFNDIKLSDIDLEKGTITIRRIARCKTRTLPLKSHQVMLFYKYIYEIRPKLLALSKQPSDHFLLNIRGYPESGMGVHNLIDTKRHYFPDRKLTTVTIRQSVIANYLKEGKDIRVVQEFAGHSSLVTTEKYRENNLNELQNIIQKYHPLA